MKHKLARISVLVLVGSLVWINQLFDRFSQNTRIEHPALTAPQIVPAASRLVSHAPELCGKSIDSYSWVRSLKGDGREYVALLMVGRGQHLCDFRLSLEATMKTAKWNSKDLLMVWGESEISVERNFRSQEEETAAILRQAIILQFRDQQFSSKVHFDSLSGILPNQDWLNVFLKEARKFGVRTEISRRWDGVRARFDKSEIGLHGNFSTNGIAAYTVLVGAQDREKFPGLIERCLRAASNLEEQLSRSVYFYFFISDEKFVGLGEYLLPLISVLSPIFVGLVFSDFSNLRSRLTGGLGLAATLTCVPLALLRPELSLFVNPIVGLTGAVVLIAVGKFLNS